ncbi:MAG TPA: thioredoxin domain-containing protein [Pyrinomonadaceae bacterium]|nr:thioredoxin domain-containing protein [Pyrinomonadaceae bacterium]
MNFKLLSLRVILVLWSPVLAQKSKRRGSVRTPVVKTPQPQPQPVAQPAATTRPAPQPTGPTSLVVVNGQTFTTADLQPALRQELERVDQKIAEARAAVLDQQINTVLLQAEATKRRVDTPRLYQLEVSSRVPAITNDQIKKFIDDNSREFAGMDPALANQQASAFLRQEAENKLADDLVKRLRKTHSVAMGVDVNSPNLSPNAVVATIDGFPLKAEPLIERLKPIIYKMRLEAYEVTKNQTDQLVDDSLLLEEARRRQIGPEEIIRAEISDKVRPPTEDDVTKFYNDNKARISGDLNSVRNQVANYLQEQSRQRLEKDLSERLRKGANIRWLISEPAAPVQNISTDDDPARGDANAPVTIVEFTDFQCPACAAMHPVLDEVLKSYGNKVRFVVRDFPLNQHQYAHKAAEAANAANAQGKFFEYAALLFKNQKALDVPSLKKYASDLGLNRARFDAALDRGTYAAEVKKDIEDGEVYGVGSTPTIFINGVQLRALTEEALREAIDRAIGNAGKTNSSPK